ncbi:MAG: diacylglycerol kinase family lipid kinase [Bacteroidetes bacterium]|nr:diacylglycerol kinase family lipid kinase [Bacteroidota bacterium]MBS1739222.1 diacylglycerol kinase family lipid kinase [Bacteroidota bacterium]
MEEQQRILFVLNPIAGKKGSSLWRQGIQQFFENSIHAFDWFLTTGTDDLSKLQYAITKYAPQKVACIGGDGTLSLVAKALIGTDIPITLFPAGSANGMARELKMPNNVEGCLAVLLQGEAKKIDTILINQTEVCVHLSDIGMNAQLVKYFKDNDMRGKLGYAREVFRVLRKRKQIDVELQTENGSLQRTGFMVVVANATIYGFGAKINPIGKLDDGLFEVIILKKLSVVELLKMLFGNHPFNPQKTEIIQAHQLTISVAKRAYFQIDGEYFGRTTKVEATIRPLSLKMILPRKL